MYKARVDELLPELTKQFNRNAALIVRLTPFMGDALKQQVKPQIEAYIAQQTKLER